MRIIAGDYKGRKIKPPIGFDVRPTTDKVKEALFSILMYDIDESVFCDLFSGSGNVGLEALSRGADKVYFCDKSRDSIKLIRENISTCRAEEYSKILQGDYARCLASISEKVDIFFIDPPYGQGLDVEAVKMISELELLAEDGVIVIEHRITDDLPEQIAEFNKIKEKKYGKVVLSIFM